MDAWIKESIESGYVSEVSAADLTQGVHGSLTANPLYDHGVAFDWSELHKRLKSDGGPGTKTIMTQAVDRLLSSGRAFMSRGGGDDGMLCTVIEVSEPWRIQPLSDQAKEWSACSCGRLPGPGAADRVLRFNMGPPGQLTVRDDVARFLDGVRQQLAAAKVDVVVFLGSFVLFAADFTTLLHRTASVHKALKQAGLQLNIHRSSLTPQRMSPCGAVGAARQAWASLPLSVLEREDDALLFATDLFLQWLQDWHDWGCQGPVQVFASLPRPDAAAAAATARTAEELEEELLAKRVRLFEVFVRRLLLPHTTVTGFKSLPEMMPEEGGDLLSDCGAQLRQKRLLVGPQKWTTLDLRLVLCQVGAYEQDPRTVFADLKSE